MQHNAARLDEMIEPLKLCKSFFLTLSQEEIRYCHWKSNCRLTKALGGETDLDLLIHAAEKSRFEQALEMFSFKRVISPPEKQYPGTEDYLGFDYDTGKLIHLHVHYKVVLGKRHVKDYHLPIEDLIFENLRVLDDISVPCAEIELLLLSIRANMKLGLTSVVRGLIKPGIGFYPEDVMTEFRFLLKHYDERRFFDFLSVTCLPLSQSILASYLNRLRKGQPTIGTVMKVRTHILKGLKLYRESSTILVFPRKFVAGLRAFPLVRRRFPPRKKTVAGGGKIFVLVGADGSGKSTLTKDLSEWLSWKLAVKTSYFGIPKTIGVRLVVLVANFFRLVKKLCPIEMLIRPLDFVAKEASARRWVFIARKRLSIFAASRQFASMGGIVVADRYPLSAFHEMEEPMDGPRIKGELCGQTSRLSEQEESYYAKIQLPSKVFVLQTRVDRLRERKGDVELRVHEAKARAVDALEDSHVIDVIDGNRPYSDVLLDVKRRIWESL